MAEATLFISPEVTLAYNDLFVPVLRKDAKPTDKPKYSCVPMWTAEAMESPETKAMLAGVQACAIAKWGADKFKTMLEEGTFESPFRRDVKSKGYPEKFARYVNTSANEQFPPVIRDRAGAIVTDKREIYAGVRVRISFGVRAYGGPGTTYKAGVSLDMRNVQKLGDGERITLGSGTDGKEFGALPAEPGAPVGLPLADMLA